MKNVLIKIEGIQELDGNSETISFAAEGTLEISEKGITLCYDEINPENPSEKTATILTAANGEVILERRGAFEATLIIAEGRRSNCLYGTPYGKLLLGVSGERAEASVDEGGGEIFLSYTLDHRMQPMSRNTVRIDIKAR